MSLRERVFTALEKSREGDPTSQVVDTLLIVLIVLNCAAIVVESFDIGLSLQTWLRRFEALSVIIFSGEYLLRWWTADRLYPGLHPMLARLRFMVSAMGVIDLLAVAPFYLPFIFPFDLRFLRMLRIVRFLRLMKLTRYSDSLQLMAKVLRERKDELAVTVFLTSLVLLVASTLMYYIEHEVQPQAFPDILSALWWAVATLTTIGYGDVYPLTGWGRLLSGVIAIAGIGLVALPTGIVSSGFIQQLGRRRRRRAPATPRRCPHCGELLDETAEARD